MFDGAKSKAIRKGLNMFLNGRYGEIQTLDLDTKEQRLDLSILLNGESMPIDITVGHYQIDDRNPDKPFVTLNQIQVSRTWMQELVNDGFEGKKIEIPPKLTPVVKMVL